MGGRSAPAAWNERRVKEHSLETELLTEFLSTHNMGCGVRPTIILLLLTSVALSQASDPPPVPSTTVSSPASSVSIKLDPDASGVVPPEQIRALLLRAEEKDLENDKQQRNYTYVERQAEHKLDAKGNAEKTEIRTSEVLEIYGEQVEKLIAKDDKPLSARESKKEDDKIQKIIDKRRNESEDARRKRLEMEKKGHEEDRKFVLEIADAFNFRLAGSEVINGRDTWVLEGEPRAGYEPKHRGAKILSKFKGRVWIDKAEAQWIKLDITAIDTISFGVFLARIHKGTRVILEQTKVNDEVWLPKYVQVRVDARVALLKNYREDIAQTFSDYKKFRTDSKMTVVGETQ
jgi:hypothetical protein